MDFSNGESFLFLLIRDVYKKESSPYLIAPVVSKKTSEYGHQLDTINTYIKSQECVDEKKKENSFFFSL